MDEAWLEALEQAIFENDQVEIKTLLNVRDVEDFEEELARATQMVVSHRAQKHVEEIAEFDW